MSDQSVFGDDFDDAGPDGRRSSGISGKRLVLLIILPLVILLAGAAVFLFTNVGADLASSVSGPKSAPAPASAPKPSQQQAAKPAAQSGGSSQGEAAATGSFISLPTMIVNLNSGRPNRQSFLKISVVLEMGDATCEPRVKALEPAIIDTMQTYLRELRVADLGGSAGLQRLREELTVRTNEVIKPCAVSKVLFKEMLVQ